MSKKEPKTNNYLFKKLTTKKKKWKTPGKMDQKLNTKKYSAQRNGKIILTGLTIK